MHPEVQQDKPGSCPKCGMQLVETKKEKNHTETDHAGLAGREMTHSESDRYSGRVSSSIKSSNF